MKKYSKHKEPSQHATKLSRSINQRGFTLLELLITMAIVGILAGMAITSISDFKNLTRISRAEAEIRALEKEILSYATDNSTYPPDNDLASIGRGGMLDPWGQPYVYRLTPVRIFIFDKINSDFDLYSYGPDKTSSNASIIGAGSDDDIVRGRDGSFVGTALNYL